MASKVKTVTRPKASKAGKPEEVAEQKNPLATAGNLKAEPKEPTNGQEAKAKEEVVRRGELKKRACGCCPVELAPLPAGQQYFEAPDGHVIVGETGRGQVIDRRLNNGRGGWINPARGY